MLRRGSYVITHRNGRGLTFTVLKWKPLGKAASPDEFSKTTTSTQTLIGNI